MIADILNKIEQIKTQSKDTATNARLDEVVEALKKKPDAQPKNDELDQLKIQLQKNQNEKEAVEKALREMKVRLDNDATAHQQTLTNLRGELDKVKKELAEAKTAPKVVAPTTTPAPVIKS